MPRPFKLLLGGHFSGGLHHFPEGAGPSTFFNMAPGTGNVKKVGDWDLTQVVRPRARDTARDVSKYRQVSPAPCRDSVMLPEPPMRLLYSYLKDYRWLVALALGARRGQPGLLAARSADLPLRHRQIRHAPRPVHDRRVLPGCGPAAPRPSAWRSSRAWPRTSRTTTSTSSRSGWARALYSDGIRHSLDLPYQVFEDQRSGETLGKLQKVRTDVERLVRCRSTCCSPRWSASSS